MTKDKSDKVFDYFDHCSRNLTPASAQHGADVLFAPCSHDPEVTEFCLSILTDREHRRADRFVLAIDKEQFIQRRAFRRYCGAKMTSLTFPLSQIKFDETENGRPYLADLPDLWFSFSSNKLGFLGARSSTHGVGVDMEDKSMNLDVEALACHFFSENEASFIGQLAELDRLRVFLTFWCLKEAALKSIGEGLPFGLDAFQFELEPVLKIVQTPDEHGRPERFSVHLVEKNNICSALVLRNNV